MAWLYRALFRISPDEARFERRGFEGEAAARERLEGIGFAFIAGYNAMLDGERALEAALERHAPFHHGFVVEGAAMACAILDAVIPGRGTRFARLLRGPGDPFIYTAHVGAGWAWARLRRSPRKARAPLDPILGWLAVDGYGFHQGYFDPEAHLRRHEVPRGFGDAARRVFDQGLGRCVWFACGADVDRVRAAVSAFAAPRRADLWSGVGLAATYAGGASEAELLRLREYAGEDAPHLAQGAVFAGTARHRGGFVPEETKTALRVIAAAREDEAARISDEALAEIDPTDPDAYERWREKIRLKLQAREHSTCHSPTVPAG